MLSEMNDNDDDDDDDDEDDMTGPNRHARHSNPLA